MRSALVALVGSAIAVTAAVASAETRILHGVDSIRFEWAPASGSPSLYLVSVSNWDGALTASRWVAEASVDLPVVPGDQIRIAVAAGGYDRSGAFRLGPQSEPSARVWIARPPQFAVSGTWLLQCQACPSVQLRSLADASVIEVEGPGLPAPWYLADRARLEAGRDLLVWRNRVTGALELSDPEDLSPIPGGSADGPFSARVVGSADFDGDGIEEFVIQNVTDNTVSLWALTPGGFERVAALPGPNAFLVVAEDLTGDGKIDLVWHDIDAGTLDVWSVVGDPRVAPSQASLYDWPAVRVVSGLFSDAWVADAGDYDGDGQTDLLVRFSDGALSVLYLNAARLRRYTVLPAATGDADRSVVGSVDVDGLPGEEIALQDRITKTISILFPAYTSAPQRVVVLTPGSQWNVVDVGE